jgi:hypothetical protein
MTFPPGHGGARARQSAEAQAVQERPADRGRREHVEAVRLTQPCDAQGVVGFGVGEDQFGDRRLVESGPRLEPGPGFDPVADAGCRVDDVPAAFACLYGERGVTAARVRMGACSGTSGARAVPLRDSATGRGAEHLQQHGVD